MMFLGKYDSNPVGRTMAASEVKELCVSPNGDRWILARNASGELVVCHHPNRPSGGMPAEIAVLLAPSPRSGKRFSSARDGPGGLEPPTRPL
jgi:hypothetical protein